MARILQRDVTVLCAATIFVLAPSLGADEQIHFTRDGRDRFIRGELIVEDVGGGVLLLADDGRLWAVQRKEITRREKTDKAFTPLSREALARKVLAELPAGFKTHGTAHFLIAYNTSDVYAQWCGALYERLYVAFYNFFERRGAKLREPRWPLVAIIFADRDALVRFSRAKLGESANGVIGYYDLETNDMVMCDLTGADLGATRVRASSAAQINRLLSQPRAAQNVAAIVHEAAHQIAFNCGLMERWSDVPMWLSEGVAVYFETPDLGRRQGWRAVGAVNRSRLAELKPRLARWDAKTFAALIAGDDRFADADTARFAYAESWAITYALLERRPKEFVAYMQTVATGKPLNDATPVERLRAFQAAFGTVSGTHRQVVETVGRLR